MSVIDTRLPAALEAACTHVRATAQAVAERVAAGLGVQAQSATRHAERDLLLATQIELRRKMNAWQLTFAKVLMDKVQQEVAPRHEPRRPAATDWQSLSLVDDHEVEERMISDRVAQQIAHACEWELRELAAYMGAVLHHGRPDAERNPLRAEVLGMAVFRAVEAVTNDPDSRRLLTREFGAALSTAMPECYRAIVADLQQRRVQPVGLALRTVHGPGQGANSGYASLHGGPASTRSAPDALDAAPGFHPGSGPGGLRGGPGAAGAVTQAAGYVSTRAGVGPSTRDGLPGGAGAAASAEADAQLMALLRRLTFVASGPGGEPALAAAGVPPTLDAPATDPLAAGLMAVNLIRTHREELRQASTGKLDHMVIDVVGSLFDQILSDPKVPPQMARQIARLQLPVLRVALADATFFSSRRHPVRRFVNRIASLACAFEEFDDGPGREFLARVRELVQEIVEGDFDQVELYAAKLTALEAFIDAQTEADARRSGAVRVLQAKESELRVQQRYMAHLNTALADVAMPEFLREFVAQVWSQALVQASRRDGADAVEQARRFRAVGRDLVMSVQPKGSPVMRKRFLVQLPGLMRDLTEGMRFVGWPDAAQKAFFARLLPAHAESLKAAPLTELEHNLLYKQLESVFNAAIPGVPESAAVEPLAPAPAVLEQRFTPDEARQVGLVDESAVDWTGAVDIDLGDAPDTVPADDPSAAGPGDTLPGELEGGVDIDLSLANPDPAEPSQGPQLMDHIRLGFAYQMLLKDQWQKVRLGYVSPGRNFFVFTRGRRHQETISLTTRMLARMCESGRLRAVEQAYLLERATARARRQLAALAPH